MGRGYRVVLKEIVNNLRQATATKKVYSEIHASPDRQGGCTTAELSSEKAETPYSKYFEATEAGRP